MFDMLHSYMYCKLCIPAIVEVSLKRLFDVAVFFFLLIFVAKKATKGNELQFFNVQKAPSKVKERTIQWCLIGTWPNCDDIFKQYPT